MNNLYDGRRNSEIIILKWNKYNRMMKRMNKRI